MAAQTVIVPIISGIAGGALLFYGFNRLQKYLLINNTPASKIRSMAMGLVELNGTAYADEYLKAPYSKAECVYYRYEVLEYKKHTSTDGKGHTSTSYSWDKIASGEEGKAFMLRDETGSIPVEPKGAEFNLNLKRIFFQKAPVARLFKPAVAQPIAEMDVKKPKFGMFFNVGDRKYLEYYIGKEERAYVLGTADNEKNKAVVRKGKNDSTFIISDKSEKEILSSMRWKMIGSFIAGAALILFGVFFIFKK